MERFLYHTLLMTQIPQYNLQIFREECHLPKPLFQNIIIKNRLLENFRVRKKCNFRPCFVRITCTDDFERIADMTALITLLVDFTIYTYLHLQPCRKRIHH